MPPSDWNDRTVARLTELWHDGLSCSQIAKKINSELGTQFSRNAIISKLYRTGLSRPRAEGGVPRITKSRAKRKDRGVGRTDSILQKKLQRRALGVAETTIEESPTDYDRRRPRVAIVDLEEHHCRWIIGDPREADSGYCGAEKIPGQSYCAHHLLRAVESPHEVAARAKRGRMILADVRATRTAIRTPARKETEDA